MARTKAERDAEFDKYQAELQQNIAQADAALAAVAEAQAEADKAFTDYELTQDEVRTIINSNGAAQIGVLARKEIGEGPTITARKKSKVKKVKTRL